MQRRSMAAGLRAACRLALLHRGRWPSAGARAYIATHRLWSASQAHAASSPCAEVPLPAELQAQVEAKRAELVEAVAEVDEELAEHFVLEEPIDGDMLQAAVRRWVPRGLCRTGHPTAWGAGPAGRGCEGVLAHGCAKGPAAWSAAAFWHRCPPRGCQRGCLPCRDRRPVASTAAVVPMAVRCCRVAGNARACSAAQLTALPCSRSVAPPPAHSALSRHSCPVAPPPPPIQGGTEP